MELLPSFIGLYDTIGQRENLESFFPEHDVVGNASNRDKGNDRKGLELLTTFFIAVCAFLSWWLLHSILLEQTAQGQKERENITNLRIFFILFYAIHN